MSTIAVQRLHEHSRSELLAHFLALSSEDRRLRFGSQIANQGIDTYVQRIDFDRDAAFGVHDDSLALVGVAHVAFLDDQAELGLSVVPGHRGRGVGGSLFERGAAHARNRSVPTLFMHCLRENAAIVRIAKRFGMRIVMDYGEADAHLELSPATIESIADEFVTDRLAVYDYALKSHVASWKGVATVLEAAARPTR